MSNEPIPSDGEQTENNTIGRIQEIDWKPYGKLGTGAVIGLLANAVIMTVIIGGDLRGIADGIAFLIPAVILSVALFHRYNPMDVPFLAPALLFLSIAMANTLTLSVKAIRESTQNPLMSLMVLGLVAGMFTPGPFLGAYAARRWWL